MLLAGDHRLLVDYERPGPDAVLSIPTPDHYLPLLYVIATGQAGGRDFPGRGHRRRLGLNADGAGRMKTHLKAASSQSHGIGVRTLALFCL